MLAVVIIQAFKIVNASATFSDEVQLEKKKERKGDILRPREQCGAEYHMRYSYKFSSYLTSASFFFWRNCSIFHRSANCWKQNNFFSSTVVAIPRRCIYSPIKYCIIICSLIEFFFLLTTPTIRSDTFSGP